MGRWRITIDGVGCHHNGNRAIDADLAAKDFVGELKAQGHSIEAARFEALGANGPDGYDAQAVDPASGMNIDLLAPAAEPVADAAAE
jgi:hypothetical protein